MILDVMIHSHNLIASASAYRMSGEMHLRVGYSGSQYSVWVDKRGGQCFDKRGSRMAQLSMRVANI